MLGFLLFLYIIGLVVCGYAFLAESKGLVGVRDTILGIVFYPIWLFPTILFYIATFFHAIWTNNTFGESWEIMTSKKVFLKLFGEKEK